MLVPRNVRLDLFFFLCARVCVCVQFWKSEKRKTPNRNVTVYAEKKQKTHSELPEKRCCAAVPGVEGGCCGRLVGRETGPTTVCANTFSLPTCSIQQLDQSPRAFKLWRSVLPPRASRTCRNLLSRKQTPPPSPKKTFRKKASQRRYFQVWYSLEAVPLGSV